MNTVKKLQDVLTYVKNTFVGKDEIIDLLGICLLARENAFLLGPPGTAKSAIVRELSASVTDGKNFEYLLTRFTEPNEIFGPFDIRRLKDGDLVTNTEGMMPEASMVFLDEIFNANSAILNSLLMALNEKIFRRGKEVMKLPALMFVGASNLMPEDEALGALLDRFLVRVRCGYVDTDLLGQVLNAGWRLENNLENKRPEISAKDIRELQLHCKKVDIAPIQHEYVNLIHALRNAGVSVSDRRAVKVQNLIAASALMADRTQADLSDLWVLKYIWDAEEQIEVLSGIVSKYVEKSDMDKPHPQAIKDHMPDAENIARQVAELKQEWDNSEPDFDRRNVIKDKLRFLQSQSNWINDDLQKTELQKQIDDLWKGMLQTA